jgi:hypothetical protein
MQCRFYSVRGYSLTEAPREDLDEEQVRKKGKKRIAHPEEWRINKSKPQRNSG